MGNTVSAMPTSQPINSRNPRICPKPWRKNPFSHSHSYRMGENPRAPHSKRTKPARPNAAGHAQRGLPGVERSTIRFFLIFEISQCAPLGTQANCRGYPAATVSGAAPPAPLLLRHHLCCAPFCGLLAAGRRNRSTAQFPILNSRTSELASRAVDKRLINSQC